MVNRVCFDQFGVLVTNRELGDTRLGAEIFIKLDRKDAPQDSVSISDEARKAALKRKAA